MTDVTVTEVAGKKKTPQKRKRAFFFFLKNIIPKKITARLGYVHVHPNHIRIDIYDRIIDELRSDSESLKPCSWLGCKREAWERIRKDILKGQKKKKKSKYIDTK